MEKNQTDMVWLFFIPLYPFPAAVRSSGSPARTQRCGPAPPPPGRYPPGRRWRPKKLQALKEEHFYKKSAFSKKILKVLKKRSTHSIIKMTYGCVEAGGNICVNIPKTHIVPNDIAASFNFGEGALKM